MLQRYLGSLAGTALLLGFSLTVAGREVALVEAVKAGELPTVRALLADGADVNAPEADGTTALHWAAEHDLVGMADILLVAGADAKAANRYGVTPIHRAATNGSAPMIERLLAAGADANTALPAGETTLMTAARAGNPDALRVLLAGGAEVDAREGWRGQTALMWAAVENNPAAIRVLIEAGAEIEATSLDGGFTAFLFSVRGGHIEASRALLEAGADVEARLPDGMSALVLALYNAHYELAGVLLDYGADPNADDHGWTALHQIAWSRRPNRGFNMPGAVATGDLDSLALVGKLVEHGADVNARMTQEPRDGNRNMLNRIGSTPFLMAAKAADVPLMRALLDQGADPSLTNDDGTTAVMVAAGIGVFGSGASPGTHEEALAAVKLALEVGGGTPNDVDRNGETAIHGAVYRGGALPVIEFLAEQGARLDVENAKGWTPVAAADGVVYASSGIRRYREAAALLRRLLAERGLPVPEPEPELPAGIASASPGGVAATPRFTNWDGVFTEPQAERGERVYRQSCAACHFEDLLGEGVAPALVGDEFAARFHGSTAYDMVQTIRATMPQDSPDSLGDQAYVDLVAYLLRVNGSPAGADELTIDRETLGQVLIAPGR